jgi:hypothetical protein
MRGRCDDRTVDVLYTSTMADGAIADMRVHLARGVPVFPSQVRYRLFELHVTLASCLRLDTLDVLSSLGLQTAAFGQLSYQECEREYPRTQEIAEAAHFFGRDALIVPSARSNCTNVIVSCQPAGPDARDVIKDHRLVDWKRWRTEMLGHRVTRCSAARSLLASACHSTGHTPAKTKCQQSLALCDASYSMLCQCSSAPPATLAVWSEPGAGPWVWTSVPWPNASASADSGSAR